MKKLLVVVVALVLLSGCTKKNLASDVVKNYLEEYINLSTNVKKSLDIIINDNNDIAQNDKKIYKKIFIKQYKDLKYTILSEEYDNNKALITVNINVYDLTKAIEDANNYLSTNLSEFYDENNNFDNEKYISYKLNLMYKSNERTDYTLVFFLNKKKKKWMLEQPTDSDLEKIHGIYKETN